MRDWKWEKQRAIERLFGGDGWDAGKSTQQGAGPALLLLAAASHAYQQRSPV